MPKNWSHCQYAILTQDSTSSFWEWDLMAISALFSQDSLSWRIQLTGLHSSSIALSLRVIELLWLFLLWIMRVMSSSLPRERANDLSLHLFSRVIVVCLLVASILCMVNSCGSWTMKQSPVLFVCNALYRLLEKTKYVLESVFKQKHYLNSLLLEYIQLSALLNSIVGKFLLQMKDLVSNHDLNFVGFKICYLLFD